MSAKPCPPGKILNPLTNRCVNVDGKIGKEILKQNKDISFKDIIDHQDVGSIIKSNLDFDEASQLHMAQKPQANSTNLVRFIELSSPYKNIPSAFTPMWHKVNHLRWRNAVIGEHKGNKFIISIGITKKKPGPEWVMLLLKHGSSTYVRYLMNISKKSIEINTYDVSDIKEDKKNVLIEQGYQIIKDSFTQLNYNESNLILHALKESKTSDSKHIVYLTPSKFNDTIVNIKPTFKPSTGELIFKGPDFKSTVLLGGHKLTDPKEKVDPIGKVFLTITFAPLLLTKLKVEVTDNISANKDISEHWATAYNALTTYLKSESLEQKEKMIKKLFGSFSNDVEELFKEAMPERYPIWFVK